MSLPPGAGAGEPYGGSFTSRASVTTRTWSTLCSVPVMVKSFFSSTVTCVETSSRGVSDKRQHTQQTSHKAAPPRNASPRQGKDKQASTHRLADQRLEEGVEEHSSPGG